MSTRFLAVLLVGLGMVSSADAQQRQPRRPRPADPPPAEPEATPEEPDPAGGAGHDDQAARWLFNSAREAFEAGDYESALDRFEQSYRLSNRPALLYNIGTTQDRLRRDADALASFQQYLALVPDSANRSEIEARVIVLQRAVDRAQAEEAERARIEAERQAAEEGRIEAERQTQVVRDESAADEGIPQWAFWTVAGTGAATLIAGGTFHIITGSRNGSYEDYVTAHQNDDSSLNTENLRISRGLYDDAIQMRNLTIAMYAATGALAIGAGIMIPFTNWGGDDAEDGEALPGEEPEAPAGEAPSGEAGLRLGPGSLTFGLTQHF